MNISGLLFQGSSKIHGKPRTDWLAGSFIPADNICPVTLRISSHACQKVKVEEDRTVLNSKEEAVEEDNREENLSRYFATS